MKIIQELKDRFATLATLDGATRTAVGASAFIFPTYTIQLLALWLLATGIKQIVTK